MPPGAGTRLSQCPCRPPGLGQLGQLSRCGDEALAMSWKSRCGDRASCWEHELWEGQRVREWGKAPRLPWGDVPRSFAMGKTRVTACVWSWYVTLSVHGKVWVVGWLLGEAAGNFPGSDGANSRRLHPRRSLHGTVVQSCLPRACSAWYGPPLPPLSARGRGALRACAVPRAELSWAVFTARARRPGLSRAEPNRTEAS